MNLLTRRTLFSAAFEAGVRLIRIAAAFAALSCAVAGNNRPVEDGFESPQYEAGANVEGTQGWKPLEADQGGALDEESTPLSASISREEFFTGSQSLRIEAGGGVARSVSADGVRFIDLVVLPVYAEGEAGTTVNLSGGWLVFAKSGSAGRVMAFSGTGGDARPVGGEYSVANGHGEVWVRVTARVDAKKNTWDLFLDGQPVKADLALGGEKNLFQIGAAAEGPIYLDDYREGAENPLFEDADKDGMPDAEEKAAGLDPNLNDRDGDLDRDGVKNVDEFFADSSLRATWAGNGAFVYVDNLNGNDANTGKTSRPATGSGGPKASIKAAMAAAASGDTIVVMKGRGIYDEGSRSAEGKRLTIKTVAPVTIR